MAFSSVIKYEGNNDTFVWKHPNEDFNSTTQLIVHESQEAIFFMNGQALDLFGPGRYTLDTQNIPQIGRLLKETTGFRSPFHCEVYFINKTVQMSIKWGTDSKVRFLEPTYGVPLELGACGEMNLMVSDSRKLLTKLVGTMNGIAWGREGNNFTKSLATSFRPMIVTAVKTSLAGCIRAQNINILDVDQHLQQLSGALKASIAPGFEEYGLTVPEFYVTNVVLPENDPSFRLIRELHTVALQKKVVEAEASIKTLRAETAAAVTVAEREAAMQREITATEIARTTAERDLIRAQTEAQATRLAGLAEAEVMRARGYTEKDVIQAEVQKAYAAGIGNLNINGTAGGATGDMLGLGVGLAAAGVVVPQITEMLKGFGSSGVDSQEAADLVCPGCGSTVPAGAKFCLQCGSKIELLKENEMLCPACGKKTPKGKFCMECGAPLVLKCRSCGTEIPNGAKFCLECGGKI